MLIRGPIKVAVRFDAKHRIIRMFLLPTDMPHPDEDSAVIATLDMGIAKNCPRAFKAFQEMAKAIGAAVTEDFTGRKPIEHIIEKPPPKP